MGNLRLGQAAIAGIPDPRNCLWIISKVWKAWEDSSVALGTMIRSAMDTWARAAADLGAVEGTAGWWLRICGPWDAENTESTKGRFQGR